MFWRCYFLSSRASGLAHRPKSRRLGLILRRSTETRLTTLAVRCRLGNMGETAILERTAVVRHGRRLEYFTITWNSFEGLVAIVAGAIAGSISLVGFGIDSFIEVTSGSVLLWRMSVDAEVHRRELNERQALRIVGACFLLVAAYITYESALDLWSRRAPEHSIPGIILACVSLTVMPLLSRAKRRVGRALGSAAMHADAKQTEFCTYLSAILLAGLLLNALFGLWWADPVAALIMVPIIAKEGIKGLQGKACDECRS
jgi:divalent metal cation (Fe/Co/Zn/Cd) transporter